MEDELKKVSGVEPEEERSENAAEFETSECSELVLENKAADEAGSAESVDAEHIYSENGDSGENLNENSDESCEEAATAEIVFTSDFTASEVRKKAVAAQKKKLANGYPKALLYSVLMTIPTLLVFIFGMSRMSAGSAAGRAIEIIALLLPVLFGGPLMFGLIGGCMDIARGGKFTVKRLFFAFKDSWFTKALGSYLLFAAVSVISMLICMIPAVIVSALSSGLSEGFASIATNVIVVLLYIAGIMFALQFILRLAMMFPLLIDHPDMKVGEAARFSVKAMRGNTWKLFILMLSYIGWYVLSIGIAVAVTALTAYAGYSYAQNIFLSGDIYTAYMIIIMGVYVIYAEAYILMTIAVSTFILRPYIAWAAFYDTMTGYEPPEACEMEAPENETDINTSGLLSTESENDDPACTVSKDNDDIDNADNVCYGGYDASSDADAVDKINYEPEMLNKSETGSTAPAEDIQ